MATNFQWLYCFVCVQLFVRVFCQFDFEPPESPCPKILQYITNGRIWYGKITFPSSMYGSQILLEVKMSLDAHLESEYVGRIEVEGNEQDIVQTFYNGETLTYRVYFPLARPIPRFTSIRVNKKQICHGLPAIGDFVTSINLEHILNRGAIIPLSGDLLENKNNINENDQSFTTESYTIRRKTTTEYTTPKGITERHDAIESCGIAPKKINALILGGDETNPGDWPWLAAMFRKKTTGLDFICSATLISNNYVVTAAHCVNEKNKASTLPENLVVKLGVYNLQDWANTNAKIANVNEIRSHPLFNRTNLAYDIALLQLDYVQFNDLIRPVCIWNRRPDLKMVVGRTGTVLGWGRDENGVLVTPTPKESQMPIVSLETCRASNPDFFIFTSGSTLCAGKRDGTGPCNGDSGGGMFLFDDGRWFIRGIVSNSLIDRQFSSGEPCTLKDYVIFTDAAQFATWMKQTISGQY